MSIQPTSLLSGYSSLESALGSQETPGLVGARIGQRSPVRALRDLLSQIERLAGKDGQITKGELERIANDPRVSPRVQRGAQWLLGDPQRLQTLMARSGKKDDQSFSYQDLKALLQEETDRNRQMKADAPELAFLIKDKMRKTYFDTAVSVTGVSNKALEEFRSRIASLSRDL